MTFIKGFEKLAAFEGVFTSDKPFKKVEQEGAPEVENARKGSTNLAPNYERPAHAKAGS